MTDDRSRIVAELEARNAAMLNRVKARGLVVKPGWQETLTTTKAFKSGGNTR